jgi:hypothetical protein
VGAAFQPRSNTSNSADGVVAESHSHQQFPVNQFIDSPNGFMVKMKVFFAKLFLSDAVTL